MNSNASSLRDDPPEPRPKVFDVATEVMLTRDLASRQTDAPAWLTRSTRPGRGQPALSTPPATSPAGRTVTLFRG
jgi:hypothetical protein